MQSFADVDPITVIKIAHAIVSFMQTTLPMNAMPWKEEYRDSCKCCGQLIIFTVKTLCESSRLNIDELETKSRKSSTSSVYSRILDGDFWEKLKSKQQDIMIRGIRFLSYLLIREPDYVLRRTDMENAFYLLIDCVKNSKNLKLHENERKIFLSLDSLDLGVDHSWNFVYKPLWNLWNLWKIWWNLRNIFSLLKSLWNHLNLSKLWNFCEIFGKYFKCGIFTNVLQFLWNHWNL